MTAARIAQELSAARQAQQAGNPGRARVCARERGVRACAAALSAAVVVCVPGCNIVAPIALIVEGPPTVDPVHKLDKSRPTIVFVDDISKAAVVRADHSASARILLKK